MPRDTLLKPQEGDNPHVDSDSDESIDQEVKNTLNAALREKLHRGILRGVRNISGTLKNPLGGDQRNSARWCLAAPRNFLTSFKTTS